jgi:hypothetical protein
VDTPREGREIDPSMLESIRSKVAAGERLTPAEGEWLLTEAPLTALGELANAERFRRHPGAEVTYVIDSNPNYTNICNIDCVFCAFYRHADASDAYTHTVEEVLEKVTWAVEQGATTVLLQGGVNPGLPLEYYLEVVRETARLLGAGVANLVNIFNPEVVVLAGGVTQAGDALFEPMRAEVRRRAFRPAVEACRIVPGALDGNAGVIGAAATFAQRHGLM